MSIQKIISQKMNTAKILLKKAALFLLKKVYFPGKKFYCPCCGHTLRRFMHYDYKSIPSMNPALFHHHYKEIQCPYCNSLPRHRIMATFLLRHPELIVDKKVVIFGMLQGEQTFFEQNNISYLSADLYADNSDIKEDIMHMSFPDNSLDVLICHHILEHVQDVSQTLREIHRVLSPKGIAILSVPIDMTLQHTLCHKRISTPKLRRKYYGQTDHLRLFGKDFPKQLQQSGFSVHTVKGENYPVRIRPVTGPAKTDINHIYVCRKNTDFSK